MMESHLHDRLPNDDEFMEFVGAKIFDQVLLEEAKVMLQALRKLRLLDGFRISLENEAETEAVVFHKCSDDNCPIPMIAVYVRMPEKGLDS